MAKVKYYVVWKGRKPGIYTDWATCKKMVDGFDGAAFKSFTSLPEAENAYESHSSPSQKLKSLSTSPSS